MRKSIIMGSLAFIGAILIAPITYAESLDILPKSEEKGKKIGFEVEVHYEGDLSQLTGASKLYAITNTLEIPTVYPNTVPSNNKIMLDEKGKKYIHVKYTLGNGKQIYVSGGPYNVVDNSAAIKSVEVVKGTNGKYSVVAKVESDIEITSVKADSNNMISEVGSNLYKINELQARPSILVVNMENSPSESIALLLEPVVNMGTYNINEKYQRGPINISVTSGTGVNLTYKIDGKAQNCGVTTCTLNINENGTLGIYGTKDNVTTGILYSIKNIDNSPMDLVMSGARDKGEEDKVNLEWNYSITKGKLICKHNGQSIEFGAGSITGKLYQLSNVTGSLECQMKGTYSEVELDSNKVYIGPIVGREFNDPTVYKKFNATKVKIDETRTGKTYYINSGATGEKTLEVVLPINAFK